MHRGGGYHSVRERFLKEAPFDAKRRAYRKAIGRELRICRWCGTEYLPQGRRSWCSDQCVDAYLIRSDPGHVRRLVKARDKGVCALCAVNTYALHREISARFSVQHEDGYRCTDYRLVNEELVRLGYTPGLSLWAADHIIPVHKGGGACGLANYRTLCVPCHKKVTASQRKRT